MNSCENLLFPGSVSALRQEGHFFHTSLSRPGPAASVTTVLLKAR